MILIVTDEVEPWFRYIWNQFVQINSLETASRITTYADYLLTSPNSKDPILEYSSQRRLPDGLFIPKRSRSKPNDFVWMSDDFPVYRESIEGPVKNYSFDILYNAFVHLSRLEEWESESKGKLIHSYSFNHPRKDKRLWKIPIVNHLFDELEKWIKSKYPDVSFGNRAKPIIEFSHDVDYISKTVQLRIKQSFFYFLKCNKHFLQFDFRKGFAELKDGVHFAHRNCNYWCFDQWRELEEKLDVRSVYYLFVQSGDRKFSPKRWLVNPSYDVTKNDKLKKKCRELISEGNKVGIHGSYFSSKDESLFIREKEMLESIVGHGITKSRQHWLNYYESKTPYIHVNARIEEDSTLGFNDISGFRAGVASLYYPYDHKNKMAFPFKEIPMVIMDSHAYDYSMQPAKDKSGWLFKSATLVKNFAISVDWHQRVLSSDYGWGDDYETLVSMLSN